MPDMTEFDKYKGTMYLPSGKTKIDEYILPSVKENMPDKYESLLTALRDRSYSARSVRLVLSGWGYDIGESSIKAWRANNA